MGCSGYSDKDDREPHDHASVETPLEEIEHERARRNEEHEDPDWPVIEAVVELVAMADFYGGIALDKQRICLKAWLNVHSKKRIVSTLNEARGSP